MLLGGLSAFMLKRWTFSPPFCLFFFFLWKDGDGWLASHVTNFTGMDPSYSLPGNVALITLQVQKDFPVSSY